MITYEYNERTGEFREVHVEDKAASEESMLDLFLRVAYEAIRILAGE